MCHTWDWLFQHAAVKNDEQLCCSQYDLQPVHIWLCDRFGVFISISAIIVRRGAAAGAAGTANDQSFDQNTNQRADQVRNQACADDQCQNGEECSPFVMEVHGDLVLEVHDEKRSNGCDALPEKDAEEKSDDDGWVTSAHCPSPANVLAAARADAAT